MARHMLGPYLGFVPPAPSNGTNATNINAANTWLAQAFIGTGKTLSAVNLYCASVTGTLTAAQLTVDIYSTDANGDPASSVAGPVNCGSTPGTGWLQWSGINYATTDGVMYWIVVKNLHGTPASNLPSMRFGQSGPPNHLGSGAILWGYNKNGTTDAGSTWASEAIVIPFFRLDWSDSTYDGSPFENVAATGTTNSVYAARELGVYLTITGATVNVRSLSFFLGNKSGTPAQNARARIYSGSSSTPTLVATSSGGPAPGHTGTGGWATFPFASVQALAAGTYRLVLGTTGADTSSNRYNSVVYTIKNDAASKALMPFGNAQQTYSTDGTTFTETDTAMVPFAIGLDNGAEFTSAGGGSGGGPLIGGRLVQ